MIKALTNEVHSMSDNMMSSFNKVIPLLQSVASSASAVSERLTGTATQTADANERVIDTEQRVGDTVNRTSDAVNQQTAAVTNYGNTVRSTQGSITALEREIGSLSTGLQSVSQSAETGFANGRAVLAFDSKLQALEQRLSEAHTRLTEFGDTNIPTEAFTTLTSQISRAEQALFRLYDRRDAMEDMGVEENSKQWQRLALQIENAEYLLAQYERERDTLASNGGAFIKGSDTDEFARMQASLNDAGEVLLRNKGLIDQESLAQARLNVLTAQEAVASATTTRQREAALERLREAQAELNELANSMSNNTGSEANNAPTEETVSRWSRFGSVLRSAGAAALKVSGTLALMPFKTAAKGFQKLASGIKNYISNAKKAHKESNFLVKSLTSLKRMLITRIKRMFISAVFNEVKEALKSLAKFSDGFNAAMSNIKNSSKQFAGNLAVSLGGVVQAIEPMITGLLDRLSTAFTYINAFFAVLGGKSTMTVAKKQTDSYRDSLDGASKAAENLKNQTYGFDELNKRSSDDKSRAGNGSDMYEEVPIDSVIPDKLKSLFDELKKLWDNGEYFNFGKKFAELLNGGMQTIDDWINGTLRPKGTEWAKNFAEILNGLVDGFDWGLLGKTVADGLNAVADICNTFFTTFDFVKLGSGIGTAVNSWFSNIDWTLHAQTIANGLNSIAGIIYGFVSTLDWAQVGDSIAAFVQSFFDSIDWTTAADIISTAINGIAETFLHFVNDVDWQKIGSDCLASVSKALTDIDWGSAFQAVIDGFNALEELILGAIQGIDWQGIATELGNGINSIDIQELLTNAGKIVSDFISGVFTFATEFIETVDWFELTQKLWDGFFGMLANVDWGGLISQAFELLGAAIASSGAVIITLGENIWSALKSAWESVKTYFSEYIDSFGGDIVAGLWAGIKNAFVGVGEWIKENIFGPFIRGFEKVFDISSPSKVMEEEGEFITKGFLNGITNTWNTITDFFGKAWEGIKTTASKAWESIKTTASGAWESIKSSAIGKKVSGIVSNAKDMGTGIQEGLSSAWKSIKTKASDAWDGLKTTISDKISDAKNDVSDIGEKLKTGLSNTWTDAKETAGKLWDGIKTTVSDTYTNLKTALGKTSDNIKSSIQKTWKAVDTEADSSWKGISSTVNKLWEGLKTDLNETDWKSVGSNLVNGLKTGVSKTWNSLRTTVGELASGLTRTVMKVFDINSPSKAWAEIGEYLDLGLKQGLKSEEGTVLSTVSGLAKNVNKELSGQKATLRIGTESDALLSRLNGIAERLANIVTAFQGINNALNRMGGFSIPIIASGSEVPYKTRIGNDGEADIFNSHAFTEFSSGVDERLVDIASTLKEFMSHFDKKRTLDPDDMAQAIAYAIRGANRGYGV